MQKISAPGAGALIGLAFILGSGTELRAQDAPAALIQCVTCHGRDGQGTTPLYPNLGGQSAIYLTKQLQAFRSGERMNEQMSIIAQGLTDADIVALSDYYEKVGPVCD